MATAPRLKLIPIAMLAFPPRSASWNEEMEKRSRRRIRDLVARPASLGLSENEIGCARISMVARNTNVPFKGRIQKRKTYHLQILTFRLQRAAGPYKTCQAAAGAMLSLMGGTTTEQDVNACLDSEQKARDSR